MHELIWARARHRRDEGEVSYQDKTYQWLRVYDLVPGAIIVPSYDVTLGVSVSASLKRRLFLSTEAYIVLSIAGGRVTLGCVAGDAVSIHAKKLEDLWVFYVVS